MNLVYSAPYFKIIIVIKADFPDEIISFKFTAGENTFKYLMIFADIQYVSYTDTYVEQFQCLNSCGALLKPSETILMCSSGL